MEKAAPSATGRGHLWGSKAACAAESPVQTGVQTKAAREAGGIAVLRGKWQSLSPAESTPAAMGTRVPVIHQPLISSLMFMDIFDFSS